MLQLVSLLLVKDAKGVEVLGATDLELHNSFALLDSHRPRILPSCGDNEIFDLVDLLRLWVNINTCQNKKNPKYETKEEEEEEESEKPNNAE